VVSQEACWSKPAVLPHPRDELFDERVRRRARVCGATTERSAGDEAEEHSCVLPYFSKAAIAGLVKTGAAKGVAAETEQVICRQRVDLEVMCGRPVKKVPRTSKQIVSVAPGVARIGESLCEALQVLPSLNSTHSSERLWPLVERTEHAYLLRAGSRPDDQEQPALVMRGPVRLNSFDEGRARSIHRITVDPAFPI
jgi:hypothetical protein